MASNGMDRGSTALGGALTFAVAVAAFAWGGHRADLALGTRPLFLVIGAALGALGGFLHVVLKLAPDALPWSSGGDESEDPPQSTTGSSRKDTPLDRTRHDQTVADVPQAPTDDAPETPVE
jgi:hypothetical protein